MQKYTMYTFLYSFYEKEIVIFFEKNIYFVIE